MAFNWLKCSINDPFKLICLVEIYKIRGWVKNPWKMQSWAIKNHRGAIICARVYNSFKWLFLFQIKGCQYWLPIPKQKQQFPSVVFYLHPFPQKSDHETKKSDVATRRVCCFPPPQKILMLFFWNNFLVIPDWISCELFPLIYIPSHVVTLLP